MANLISADEALRRAIAWISEEHRDRPDESLGKLAEQAALRFDLSPAQQDWLLATLTRPPAERPIP